MILYGFSFSPFVRKVMIVAAEKGIELENKPVAPHSDDPEFIAVSPLGKIPAFRDDDYTLADSTAIVNYLDAKFPQLPMIPLEPKARGKAIWFEEYADTIMFPVGTVIFINRVLLPKLRKIDGDNAKADEFAKQVPPLFSYLESVVPVDGFLVADGISIADISIVSMLINLSHSGVRIDAVTHPALAAYYARLTERKSVKSLITLERRMFGLQ